MALLVRITIRCFFAFFFLNATPTTEIYTLSLHDALPISPRVHFVLRCARSRRYLPTSLDGLHDRRIRSEEHTSELQSHHDLVCRLLLEKKNTCKSDGLNTLTNLLDLGNHGDVYYHYCKLL